MAGWFSVCPDMLPLDCMHACSHYCVVLFFIVFALPSGHSCTRLLPPSSSWIWRQFHLDFGILTFGYCLLEIHLICAVSTPRLIQQKPFLPEVVCGICGKVDNAVLLLGRASLCFSGVFQGCRVSRVLFEFHSCLWLPWEFSKGAFPDFWRANKPVCNPVICGLIYLSRIAWSQLLLSCVQHPPSDLQFTTGGCSCASAFCGHLPEHTVAHLPHSQEFMFFRNVLVTSEKQQIFVIKHCPSWCVFGGSDIWEGFLKFLMGGQGEMWFYGL